MSLNQLLTIILLHSYDCLFNLVLACRKNDVESVRRRVPVERRELTN